MSKFNPKKKVTDYIWSRLPKEAQYNYVHTGHVGAYDLWHLCKYYTNTPDLYVKLLDSEYEKPFYFGKKPSVSVIVTGGEAGLKNTLMSLENLACARIESINSCGDNISEADSIIRKSESEYIAFVQSGIVLAKRALYECGKIIRSGKKPGLIYSDEDFMDEEGIRDKLWFKPDYAPDLLMSVNYYGGFVVVSKKAYEEAGGFIESADPYYDLFLRISERESVEHVDRILFHRTRDHEKLPVDPEAVKRALERRGLKGSVSVLEDRCIIDHETDGLVSIIIPSKDNPEYLTDCLTSLDEVTLYRNYEIILVDNGSSDENRRIYEDLAGKYGAKYIYEKKDFNFSYMCNLGAKNAKGDVLVFLNDDIKITEARWLGSMAGQARVPYAGAVGCMLLYPEGNMIQHCGTKDCVDGPNHIYQGYHPGDEGCPDALFPNDVNGVTAACLAVSRSKFDEVGGFDEEMSVCYNDVALCYDLINAGYVNCVRGDIRLIHKESVSRGTDDVNETKYRRLIKEHAHLYSKHALKDSPHPYYNINLAMRYAGTGPDYTRWMYKVKTKVREMTPAEVKAWENAKVIDDYSMAFDEIDSFKYVHIFGWGYAPGYNMNHKTDRKMVIYDDKHHYVAELQSWYRPDAYKIQRIPNTEFCGFIAQFDHELIEEGRYKLSLWTNIGKADTGKELIR